ncbi:MAG: AbrB/MazE/SpoVT family DNA-binding domain-containing protein [Candidatus Dormibacteria bacterium]
MSPHTFDPLAVVEDAVRTVPDHAVMLPVTTAPQSLLLMYSKEMRSVAAKVTSKGQVTIPQPVREQLGLHAGDRVVFRLGEPGLDARETAIVPEGGGLRSTVAKLPDLVSLGGTMPAPRGRAGHSWTEIREAAWDEEVRRRR